MSSRTDKKLKVFLCHASSDKAVVGKLYELLLRDGMDVWLDSENLLPGQDWKLEIPKAVRAADAIIICISNQSVNHEGYLQKEIKLALDIADEKPDGTIFLIPARLEDCPVPDRLGDRHWVNLFEQGGYERLLLSLQSRAAHLGIVGIQQTLEPNKSIRTTGSPSADKVKELQKELIVLLRDPNRFSSVDLYLYWQDYIDPIVDWNRMMRVGKSQAELAGELVGEVTRNGNLEKLAGAVGITGKGPTSQTPFFLDLEKDFVTIPAGTFWMGSKDDQVAEPAEMPQHEMKIPYEFQMARTLVTHGQFSAFLKQMGKEYSSVSAKYLDHPVTNVAWHEAVEYCKWLTRTFRNLLKQGYAFRLPSEAEWELAARGLLPSKHRYPWGNDWSTSELSLCNSLEEGLGSTSAVGAYSPHGDSPYKVSDMAGNVREWTRSAWGGNYEVAEFKYPYIPSDGRENLELSNAVLRVTRGGSFSDGRETVTCTHRYRHFPTDRLENVGFRVAITLVSNWSQKRFDEKKVVPNLVDELAKRLPVSKRK
jgi:formylglycine-generating enzyme required for sulfatase activity